MMLEIFGWEITVQKKPASESVPKPKAEAPKKPRISKCPIMNKRMFTREQAKAESIATKVPNIRIYCCEFCGTWHLTHKKNKLKMH